jgi:hypothetical protein
MGVKVRLFHRDATFVIESEDVDHRPGHPLARSLDASPLTTCTKRLSNGQLDEHSAVHALNGAVNGVALISPSPVFRGRREQLIRSPSNGAQRVVDPDVIVGDVPSKGTPVPPFAYLEPVLIVSALFIAPPNWLEYRYEDLTPTSVPGVG